MCSFIPYTTNTHFPVIELKGHWSKTDLILFPFLLVSLFPILLVNLYCILSEQSVLSVRCNMYDNVSLKQRFLIWFSHTSHILGPVDQSHNQKVFSFQSYTVTSLSPLKLVLWVSAFITESWLTVLWFNKGSNSSTSESYFLLMLLHPEYSSAVTFYSPKLVRLRNTFVLATWGFFGNLSTSLRFKTPI